MIARIWEGRTSLAKSEAYKKFLLQVAVHDYKSVKGLLGLQFLQREENNEVRFTLITFWPSIEVIKKFAGADYEKAKYYPNDHEYLLEFPEKVKHYEVFYNELIN
jgi:heme-degrading monooxygenase HmoA